VLKDVPEPTCLRRRGGCANQLFMLLMKCALAKVLAASGFGESSLGLPRCVRIHLNRSVLRAPARICVASNIIFIRLLCASRMASRPESNLFGPFRMGHVRGTGVLASGVMLADGSGIVDGSISVLPRNLVASSMQSAHDA
jgi:hypothetical protein